MAEEQQNTTPSAKDIAVEIKDLEQKMKEENPGLPEKVLSSITGLIKGVINKFFSKEFIPEAEPVKSDKEKRNMFLIDKITKIVAIYFLSNTIIAVTAILTGYPLKSIIDWVLFLFFGVFVG